MISAQPGLIPQAAGKLTCSRILSATIFMDYLSNYVYTHLMRDSTKESTLEAKHYLKILMLLMVLLSKDIMWIMDGFLTQFLGKQLHHPTRESPIVGWDYVIRMV